MTKFPIDAPKRKVIRALEQLGFKIVREREHISMIRENPDGTKNKFNYVLWNFSDSTQEVSDVLRKKFKSEKLKSTEKKMEQIPPSALKDLQQ